LLTDEPHSFPNSSEIDMRERPEQRVSRQASPRNRRRSDAAQKPGEHGGISQRIPLLSGQQQGAAHDVFVNLARRRWRHRYRLSSRQTPVAMPAVALRRFAKMLAERRHLAAIELNQIDNLG
jgi:hypothetical protein